MTEIEELIEILRDNGIDDQAEKIYLQIRKKIQKEIIFSDLSMVRMLNLMLELYRTDRKLFEIVLAFLASPLQSMQSIGQQFRVNKSTVWRALKRAAEIHPEINLLLQIRLQEVKQGPQRRRGVLRDGDAPGGGRRVLPEGCPPCEVKRASWGD